MWWAVLDVSKSGIVFFIEWALTSQSTPRQREILSRHPALRRNFRITQRHDFLNVFEASLTFRHFLAEGERSPLISSSYIIPRLLCYPSIVISPSPVPHPSFYQQGMNISLQSSRVIGDVGATNKTTAILSSTNNESNINH